MNRKWRLSFVTISFNVNYVPRPYRHQKKGRQELMCMHSRSALFKQLDLENKKQKWWVSYLNLRTICRINTCTITENLMELNHIYEDKYKQRLSIWNVMNQNEELAKLQKLFVIKAQVKPPKTLCLAINRLYVQSIAISSQVVDFSLAIRFVF